MRCRQHVVSSGRLPRDAPARKGHWRIGVPYGEDLVLVRRAHERTEPLVDRGFAQFFGECCLDAVQRRAEDIGGQPTSGADAQAQVCVGDEVLLQHEAHCGGMIKPCSLEG